MVRARALAWEQEMATVSVMAEGWGKKETARERAPVPVKAPKRVGRLPAAAVVAVRVGRREQARAGRPLARVRAKAPVRALEMVPVWEQARAGTRLGMARARSRAQAKGFPEQAKASAPGLMKSAWAAWGAAVAAARAGR